MDWLSPGSRGQAGTATVKTPWGEGHESVTNLGEHAMPAVVDVLAHVVMKDEAASDTVR